jgi:hypothetical protein
LNDLNQFEFDFELNLTAARNCSQVPPISRCRPTMMPVPHAVPSPSLPCGHLPPPDPPFLYPPPPRCVAKRAMSSLSRPFSLPPPSSSLLERDRAPIPLASCPPWPSVPSPLRWEIEAAATTSTPHGELPPSAIVIPRHRPFLTPRPTLVLQDPPKLTADQRSPTPQ